ncbi:helix-turn-helix domain-containing protein [Anaerostipes caccae]|uniref:helix-turn-helix domain-containing protein n=1 Tax=Anaerostipes caccae TaxID=105841 RepID=UPI0038D3F7AD
MNNKEIGKRITFAREKNNLNKKELAHKIGVADSTIKRYEDGDIKKIKIPVIESIANALGVNPMWLIGKSSNMNPQKNNISNKNEIFPPEIRAAARGMMELSPENQKTAFEMIKFLSERGKKD